MRRIVEVSACTAVGHTAVRHGHTPCSYPMHQLYDHYRYHCTHTALAYWKRSLASLLSYSNFAGTSQGSARDDYCLILLRLLLLRPSIPQHGGTTLCCVATRISYTAASVLLLTAVIVWQHLNRTHIMLSFHKLFACRTAVPAASCSCRTIKPCISSQVWQLMGQCIPRRRSKMCCQISCYHSSRLLGR